MLLVLPVSKWCHLGSLCIQVGCIVFLPLSLTFDIEEFVAIVRNFDLLLLLQTKTDEGSLAQQTMQRAIQGVLIYT